MRLKTKLMVMCVTAAVALVVGVVASAQNLHVTGQVQADTGPHWFLGNVGIGTPTPHKRLEVSAGTDDGILLSNTASVGQIYLKPVASGYGPLIHGNGTQLTLASAYNSGEVTVKSGSVGIGTAAPGAKLDVTGAAVFDSASGRPIALGGGGMIYSKGDSGGWAFGLHAKGSSGTDRGGFGFLGGADALSYYYIGSSYSSPTMVVQPNAGNVGIGTMTPGQRLDVSGNINASGSVYWGGGSGQRTESKDDAGVIASRSGFFQTSAPVNYYAGASSWQHLIEARHTNDGNNYALQIAGSFFDQELYFRKTNNSPSTAWNKVIYQDSGGNVGIGTTGPGAKLHVAGATAQADGSLATGILGNAWNHWTYFGGPTGGRIRGAPGDGYLVVDSHPSGTNNRLYLNLGSPGTVAIAAGGGNVGIGTTEPGAKLDVAGTAKLRSVSTTVPPYSGYGLVYWNGGACSNIGEVQVRDNGTDAVLCFCGRRGGAGLLYCW